MTVRLPEGSCLAVRFLPTPPLTFVQRQILDRVVCAASVVEFGQLLKSNPTCEHVQRAITISENVASLTAALLRPPGHPVAATFLREHDKRYTLYYSV